MNILSDQDIREQLKWQDVLGVLEQAFQTRYQNPNAFSMPERVGITLNKNTYLTMPCADSEGWFGVKQVSVIPDNGSRNKPSVQAWYTLFDTTGTPALACSATLLTKFRTSAVSAIAAKYLANERAKTLLVVGTGSLAPWMAEAHAQVRDYENILVWGRNVEKAQLTAKAIGERLQNDISIAEDLQNATQQADVITVATTSRTPIIKGEWLRDGQHLDLVGAFVPEMIEVDADAVKGSSVFVDDLHACKVEAGDLIQATEHGWSWESVNGDLAKVVSEKIEKGNITLFKSVGLALEDLVVAKLLV
jgi:ornithine cyclodeaminase/alanine dehydrogenase-like protein (mu-crystallin family)